MTAFVTPYAGFIYHPHQQETIAWMADREAIGAEYARGGILAHEMGLGKTWTSIGHILNSPAPSHTLILVPPALQSQWEEALNRARIAYDVLIAAKRTATHGERFASVHVKDTHPGIRVTLGTYVRAAQQSDSLLVHGPFDRIMCDEGHILRNGSANRTFRKIIALPIACRWILSGTPVQNSKKDFTNLCTFLGINPIEISRQKPNIIAKAIVSRYTIDSAGATVAAMLPPRKPSHTIHSIVMPTDSDEAQIFKSLVGRFNLAVESHAKTMIILELYLRIRQFLAHPAIYVDAMKRKYGERYCRTEWVGTASKMEAFAAFMSTTVQESTIVFCNFRNEMERAKMIADAAGYKTFVIRGGMSELERSGCMMLSRHEAATGTPVCMLVQIVAGGAGLNLQHCSRVVFLSSHWNPAVVDQAVARAYRMGQTHHVTVHHFLMANGDDRNIDRVMMHVHAKKRLAIAEIHPGLACSTAVGTDEALLQLDDTLASAPPELSDEMLEAEEIAHECEGSYAYDAALLASQHALAADV
jgi:SNF2 family DNA or RNA helicase